VEDGLRERLYGRVGVSSKTSGMEETKEDEDEDDGGVVQIACIQLRINVEVRESEASCETSNWLGGST